MTKIVPMNIIYNTGLENVTEDMLTGFFARWKNPLTPRQHIKILENSYAFVLAVDKNKNKVVGFINCLSDEVQFAFIPMLEVSGEYQKRGIGSELMRRLLALIKNIDCVDLTCDPEMQSFYERFHMLKSHGMVIRRYLDRK